MEYVLLIWLAGVSEKVVLVATLLVSLYATVVFIHTVAAANDHGFLKEVPKLANCGMVGLLAIATLLPDKQTIYIMAGAMAAQDLAASTLGQKTLILIETKLDEALQEKAK
jgi:hypothetical protein